MEKPLVTFVSPRLNFDEDTNDFSAKLESELGIVIQKVDSVTDLFPLLSDPSYHTDMVAIDLEKLVSRNDGVNIFDIINTLSTLIKCTVHRKGKVKPVKRQTKICILVTDTATPTLIKQAMLIPNSFIGLSLGGTFTYEVIKENLARNLSGDFRTPKPVLDLLKPKKGSIVKQHTIDLTPRENQILCLIKDRGASNKVIAKMLDISESTVKLHVGKVLKKYGCKNRTQLALFSK